MIFKSFLSKSIIILTFCFISFASLAQNPSGEISKSFQKFLDNAELKYATVGFYVTDLSTSTVLFSANEKTGLVPASAQKIITSATSFAQLGSDFTFETELSYTGEIVDSILYGNIYIIGNGDPTLGSGRYEGTNPEQVLNKFLKAISQQGINAINGKVISVNSFLGNSIPNGWIYEDLGSYYGAGAHSLNWMENRYDVYLKSGNKIGDTVSIVRFNPSFITDMQLNPKLVSGEKGSGDNAYIFFPLGSSTGVIRGSIPFGENNFKISGSLPNPGKQLAVTLESFLKKVPPQSLEIDEIEIQNLPKNAKVFYKLSSPTLTDISYWFLNKSINLYGEALLNKLGGLKPVQAFWQKLGIEPSSMRMQDGSGLSPTNRVTPETLVRVLQYSKNQKWFDDFFKGFPNINGIKMKSGTMSGVLAYTGIIKSKNGKEYAFALIVNNYDGAASAMRKKMWQLLDELK